MAQQEAPVRPKGDSAFVDAESGRLTSFGLLVMEQMWRQLAAGFVVVPCIVEGTNDLILTPKLTEEGARSYGDYMVFAGVAVADSTGAMTARVKSRATELAVVNLYKDGGATQAGAGDVLLNRLFLFVYNSALNGGAGGLVLK